MMSTNILSPVTTPGLLYPGFGKLKPGKKHYKCPRCYGTNYSQLSRQIIRKEDIVFGFKCYYCKHDWFVSSKLLLNEIFEDQIERMARFTKKTGKEFAALIIKCKDGIKLDMIEVGEDSSVTFKQTRQLKKDEQIVGTIHNHPYTNEPSKYDIATFLRDDWEKISIVNGAKGTITVMVKTEETVKVENVKEWLVENKDNALKKIGKEHNFLIFRGKLNNLKLVVGKADNPFTSLEKLLKNI